MHFLAKALSPHYMQLKEPTVFPPESCWAIRSDPFLPIYYTTEIGKKCNNWRESEAPYNTMERGSPFITISLLSFNVNKQNLLKLTTSKCSPHHALSSVTQSDCKWTGTLLQYCWRGCGLTGCPWTIRDHKAHKADVWSSPFGAAISPLSLKHVYLYRGCLILLVPKNAPSMFFENVFAGAGITTHSTSGGRLGGPMRGPSRRKASTDFPEGII